MKKYNVSEILRGVYEARMQGKRKSEQYDGRNK